MVPRPQTHTQRGPAVTKTLPAAAGAGIGRAWQQPEGAAAAWAGRRAVGTPRGSVCGEREEMGRWRQGQGQAKADPESPRAAAAAR